MKPLRRGKETGLVEIPANWYVYRHKHIIPESKTTFQVPGRSPAYDVCLLCICLVEKANFYSGSSSLAQTRMDGYVLSLLSNVE